MKRVLLTGFEPFDGADVNESWKAVRLVADGWSDPAVELVTARLPVTFEGAPNAVLALAAEHGPFDAIVNAGLDARAGAIKLERLAANIADARIPDNDGVRPVDEPLETGGPAGIWATLPVRAIEERLKEANTLVELSYSAGTYVCNATFYRVARAFDGTPTRVGFVHIPPVQTMPVETVARALTVVLKALTAA